MKVHGATKGSGSWVVMFRFFHDVYVTLYAWGYGWGGLMIARTGTGTIL